MLRLELRAGRAARACAFMQRPSPKRTSSILQNLTLSSFSLDARRAEMTVNFFQIDLDKFNYDLSGICPYGGLQNDQSLAHKK